METELEIVSTLNNNVKLQEDIVNIFVEGFHKDFLNFCDNKQVLKELFFSAFQLGSFFVAYLDKKPVGIITYSDNKKRAMYLTEEKCIKYLGDLTGAYAYKMMQNEFLTNLTYDDNTAYIDIIITSQEARGKRVAKKLLNHVFKSTKYSNFILEVGDTNEVAINVYKKIGFVEFERKKELFPKETGFNERIFMKITP